jgi:hypothetical protein
MATGGALLYDISPSKSHRPKLLTFSKILEKQESKEIGL